MAIMALIALASSCKTQQQPKGIILDTDWWTDVDDAMAVRLLKSLQDQGKIEAKGICLAALDSQSVATLSGLMHYEGLDDVPLGADYEATDFPGEAVYRQTIIDDPRAKGLYTKTEDCSDCVDFYTKILKESKDKIDIVTIGFPNCIARLLEAEPELVKSKVGHLWMMAGRYPEGREYNICCAPRSSRAAAYVCENWPTEITFLGWEVGDVVRAGGKLKEGDLVHNILVAHGSAQGRCAWDPLTLLLAAEGLPEAAGFTAVRGRCKVNAEDGSNTFEESPDGPHSYVVMAHEPEFYASWLDSLLER